jgi:uncharacterized protein YdeI (YjbR/CyaY-like superfamily)
MSVDFFNFKIKIFFMLKKGEHIQGVPAELEALLAKDKEAKFFFEALAKSHKQAYCDWVGSAKQETTRQTRAGKALLMLERKQKALKT